MAVHAAKMHRQVMGLSGTEGLTELQKRIYELVQELGQVSSKELAAKLKLSIAEIERQITVLRHCELLKGTRQEGNMVVTIMQGGPGALELG